jgi:hypothetical protein
VVAAASQTATAIPYKPVTQNFSVIATFAFPLTMFTVPTVVIYNPSTGAMGTAYSLANGNFTATPVYPSPLNAAVDIVGTISGSDTALFHFGATAEL